MVKKYRTHNTLFLLILFLRHTFSTFIENIKAL